MSYAKSIFFIPVWFNDFHLFTDALDKMDVWENADYTKLWVKYLYPYASSLTKTQRRSSAPKPKNDKKIQTVEKRREDVFAYYVIKDLSSVRPYMYEDVLALQGKLTLEDVRFSCFATGVGFLEFRISYQGMTPGEIADFAYHFKKANGAGNAYKRNDLLFHIAQKLLPESIDAKLFFSAAHKIKAECSGFHFLHLDEEIPDEETRKSTLFRLSRSYRSDIPVAEESDYDMVYEASRGDYWGGSPEGMVNIVYDYRSCQGEKPDYYLHNLKLSSLEHDYYFMYLLLLNQKYSAVEYIRMVSLSLERSANEVEQLNKRIVQLKNMFTFNVISDDSIFQNVYAKMYRILEIKSLLEDVIENENQLDYLQNAKQVKSDLVSNKYLFGLSILTLFSAAVDLAGYIDRYEGDVKIATWVSALCVLGIAAFCGVWAMHSIRK